MLARSGLDASNLTAPSVSNPQVKSASITLPASSRLTTEDKLRPCETRDSSSKLAIREVAQQVDLPSPPVNEADDVELWLILLREPALRKTEGDRAATLRQISVGRHHAVGDLVPTAGALSVQGVGPQLLR